MSVRFLGTTLSSCVSWPAQYERCSSAKQTIIIDFPEAYSCWERKISDGQSNKIRFRKPSYRNVLVRGIRRKGWHYVAHRSLHSESPAEFCNAIFVGDGFKKIPV
jgi:hypothetical protein